MRVFISWSGETSRKLGETLRKWLPSALHVSKPYFTPDDIEKGTRWEPEISKELEKADFGIICLTHDNMQKPWIMFEAGALAKRFEASRVCPLLFGVDTPQVQGPLSQFQSAKFTKQDMNKLFRSINSLCGEHKLDTDVLGEVFDMWWPKLEQPVTQILKEAESEKPSEPPSEPEMLREILELTRVNVELTRRAARSASSRLNTHPFARLSKQLHEAYTMCVNNGYADVVPTIAQAARHLEQTIAAAEMTKRLPNTLARLRGIQEREGAQDSDEA